MSGCYIQNYLGLSFEISPAHRLSLFGGPQSRLASSANPACILTPLFQDHVGEGRKCRCQLGLANKSLFLMEINIFASPVGLKVKFRFRRRGDDLHCQRLEMLSRKLTGPSNGVVQFVARQRDSTLWSRWLRTDLQMHPFWLQSAIQSSPRGSSESAILESSRGNPIESLGSKKGLPTIVSALL